jgi:hypothetical protein
MGIACEKCGQGEMASDKVYRMSGCLVMIGYLFVVAGALIMLGAVGFSFLGLSAGTKSLPETLARENARTEGKMAEAGLPPFVIEEYHRTKTVSSRTLGALPQEDRRKADRILSSSTAGKTGAVVGTAGMAVCGGAFTMAALAAGLPMFVLGFLFVLKRKVWRCLKCGYIYDRA